MLTPNSTGRVPVLGRPRPEAAEANTTATDLPRDSYAVPEPRTDPGIADVEAVMADLDQLRAARRNPTELQGRVDLVSERRQTQPTAPGQKIGSFTLLSQASLGTFADTNIYRVPQGSADAALVATGQTRLRSDWSRHLLQLDAAITQRVYARRPSEDRTTWQLASRSMLQMFGDSVFDVRTELGRYTLDRGTPGNALIPVTPVLYNRTFVGADAVLRGTHYGATLSAQVDRRDYQNARTLTGLPFDQQFRDYTGKTLSITLERSTVPDSAFFIYVDHEWYDYRVNRGFNNDSQATVAQIGVRGEISPVIRASFAMGVLQLSYDEPLVPNDTSVSFDASLDWAVTPLTSLQFAAGRSPQKTTFGDSIGGVRTLVRVRADHELLRNLTLSGSMERQLTEFPLLSTNDLRWRESMGMQWLIHRALSANLALGGEQRRYGSRSGIDYQSYTMTFGIRAAF